MKTPHLIIAFILLFGIAGAQTIPNSLVNATTHVQSVPQMLSYTFALPFAGIGIAILAWGIAYVRSKRLSLGLMVSFVTTGGLFLLTNNNFMPVVIPITLFGFMSISILNDLHKKKR